MKSLKAYCLIPAFVLSATVPAQEMHNERFKLRTRPDAPLKDFVLNKGLSVSGVWQPESKDKGKAGGDRQP
jgi:hypothetical protein